MSYFLLSVVHILGVLFLFTALGATLMHVLNGGTKEDNPWKKPLSIIHGVSLLVILLAGLGILIAWGIKPSQFEGWVWAKIVIWAFFGAAIVLPYKVPQSAKLLMFLLPLIGGLAVFLAVYKPF